jgi:methyl-accepting chemotaxis protein
MLELQDYQGMFERSPLAQVVIDKNTRIIALNKAFCSLMGYDRDRLDGMNYSDLRTKGMIKYLKDTGYSSTVAIARKRDMTFETQFETRSGTHIVIQSCQVTLDDAGEVKYVYNTYSDITKIVKNRKYMDREMDGFIRLYDQMAAGDLTASYRVIKPEDPDLLETYEILMKLRTSVRGIMMNLKMNIGDVNTRMQNMVDGAKSANHSIEDASKGIQHIAKNAGKVRENSEKSAKGIQQIQRAMEDMSAAVEEVTSNMDSVSVLSRDTNELSRDGAKLAGNAERSMQEISAASAKVYEIVGTIETQMRDISKIVVIIRELANQTNLLALNAAIEAARAGDAGRGFAVVAAEVKSLAQESKKSAEQIEGMIMALRKSTSNASASIDESKAIVERGSGMVHETLRSFNRIAEAVDKVAMNASEVAAASEEQAATTEEITASIHEVADLIEMTANEAGDAAGASQQASAAINVITGMIHSVNISAAEAMETNRKFKVN